MQSRIDKLIAAVGDRNAVFISGYPNIYYYSGFSSEDAWLIISADRRILITDSRYFVQAAQQAPDFDIVKYEDGWEKIFKAVPEKDIYIEENVMTYGFYQELKKKSGDKRFHGAQSVIDAPRRNKDKDELKIIAEAEEIASRAFLYMLERMHPGQTEREIALELEMYMKQQGASRLSFETIAASGVRGAMPHGVASDKTVEKGELLTLDFGCVYKGYCSDMTRTVVFGSPDAKQREIYDIVLKAQTAALDGIYKGISCSAADLLAREIIKDAGYEKNFGHALGHSVGIEIHEKPVFSPKSKDTLEEGNVLSVEPGIYIEGWGGVRIEDLIAVIDGKIVDLSTASKTMIQL
ncbi:MAG: aminopeptidase P family protein [Clostridia bacterium]|nr:aminopeptidase P family protein [Clostridia bacterium]